MTSTATQDDGQLWTDQQIADRVISLYKVYRNTPPKIVIYEEFIKWRDDLLARLRTVEIERDAALRRVTKLESERSGAIFALMQHNPDALAGDIVKWIGDGVKGIANLHQELAELARIIQYIDDHAPRADDARIDRALLDLAQPQEWTPLADGMIYHHHEEARDDYNYDKYWESIEFLEVRHGGRTIVCGSMPKEDEQEANLPDDIRLCRLTPAQPTKGE